MIDNVYGQYENVKMWLIIALYKYLIDNGYGHSLSPLLLVDKMLYPFRMVKSLLSILFWDNVSGC